MPKEIISAQLHSKVQCGELKGTKTMSGKKNQASWKFRVELFLNSRLISTIGFHTCASRGWNYMRIFNGDFLRLYKSARLRMTKGTKHSRRVVVRFHYHSLPVWAQLWQITFPMLVAKHAKELDVCLKSLFLLPFSIAAALHCPSCEKLAITPSFGKDIQLLIESGPNCKSLFSSPFIIPCQPRCYLAKTSVFGN